MWCTVTGGASPIEGCRLGTPNFYGVDERGAADTRLEPAAAIMWQCAEQKGRPPKPRVIPRVHPRPAPPLFLGKSVIKNKPLRKGEGVERKAGPIVPEAV
jgi:hypothetical protein